MFTVFRTWQRWPSSLWRETQKRSILPWWPWVKWIEYSPSPLPRIPAYWCNAWNYFTGIICLSASFEASINFLTFGTVHKHCFLWIRCCCHNFFSLTVIRKEFYFLCLLQENEVDIIFVCCKFYIKLLNACIILQ